MSDGVATRAQLQESLCNQIQSPFVFSDVFRAQSSLAEDIQSGYQAEKQRLKQVSLMKRQCTAARSQGCLDCRLYGAHGVAQPSQTSCRLHPFAGEIALALVLPV